jgi:hypothetical protein
MPPEHRYVTEWSPAFFLNKAKEIDPSVEYYINQVLLKKPHPEQAYKSCQGILSIAKRYSRQQLINACRIGHDMGYYNYKTIEDIVKKNLNYVEESELPQMPEHDNIRGRDYYF